VLVLKMLTTEGGLSALAYDSGPGRFYQPAFRNIASAIAIDDGAFLDVGCGPGWLSIYVAAGKPELDAIGIDTNPAMIRLAEGNKGTRLNVTYREMDAVEIIYPEGTFSAAAAIQSAQDWQDPAAVLSEVHRVLRPGGLFYIYTTDATAETIPDGWIRRRGPWPPDAVIRRSWRKHGMDDAAWDTLKQQVRDSPFGGGEAGQHGFYRRLVLTKGA
jgi:ubiquinone/menaquinone biosynthesis C-methylase UbiE